MNRPTSAIHHGIELRTCDNAIVVTIDCVKQVHCLRRSHDWARHHRARLHHDGTCDWRSRVHHRWHRLHRLCVLGWHYVRRRHGGSVHWRRCQNWLGQGRWSHIHRRLLGLLNLLHEWLGVLCRRRRWDPIYLCHGSFCFASAKLFEG